MKQFVIIIGKLVYGIIIISFISSCSVVKTPYFKTDYYQITSTRLDKINKKTVFEIDTLRAGFSKISITPFLNNDLSTSLSEKLMPYPENVYLQALRLNNLIWFFTPGDFSGESGLLIKNLLAAKGYEAIVSGYNGSYVGYILPGKYFYLDNYESIGMGWFGPTMGDYIIDLLLKMSNSLISIR